MCLRYSFVSITSSLLDFSVFILAQHLGLTLGLSFILSRFASVCYGFPMNRVFVFHSRRRLRIVLTEYLLLVIFSGYFSYVLTAWLIQEIRISSVLSKLIAEVTLFFVNFMVQRTCIFMRRHSRESGSSSDQV